RTIVFHLKKPQFYLFGMGFLGSGTSQPIIPVEMLGDGLKTANPVGSGPYMADLLQLQVSQVYKKNPKFRDAAKGLPYIAEREFKVMPDPAVVEAACRSGQIDYAPYPALTIANSIDKDS